jgi:sterol 3beta-glucosyltransferase
MRIALLAHGSRGDIQPLLAVADELARRGHAVRMTVNTNLVAWARRTGVDVVPIEPDVEALLKSVGGRTLLATGKLVQLFRLLGEAERTHSHSIMRSCRDATEGADLVVSSVLTVYRGDCLAERLGVPHGVLSTVPYLGTRRWASFIAPLPNLGIGWLNRLTYPLMHAVMWQQAKQGIAEMRTALGLPGRRRRPRVERIRSVQLYGSALVPRPVEWEPQHEIAGFCGLRPELRASLGESEVSHDLQAWLDAGPAPVFFGFGSMPILEPARMLGWVSAIAKARRMRALVGAGWSDYGASALPEHVFLAPMFNHDRVLPRCRAAVHHGGAGTTAASLRAGLATAIISVFGDQPFWGWRLTELGAGTTLRFQSLTEGRLAAAVDEVLKDERRERARSLAHEVARENGAERAADIVESWAT